MRVLLVDVPDPLRGPLRVALGERHEVEEFDGDVRVPAAWAGRPVVDVVVHGDPDAEADASTRIERATLGTWNLLTTTSATRYVRLSTMRLFDSYDSGWGVTEEWSPRPTARPPDLAAHLAEITSRELTRSRPIEARVLRLDDVVDRVRFEAGPAPTWLHVDDAVRAIVRAVEFPAASSEPTGPRWRAWHIVRGSGRYPLADARREPLAFAPRHPGPAQFSPDAAAPAWPQRPARLAGLPRPERITLFGAGGPLGVVTYAALSDRHVLRVTDARPLAEIAARPPQSANAPVPAGTPPAPHEELVVDIADLDAVRSAAAGADCLINCAVVRADPVGAFRVNVLGALHAMLAARDAGVPRVVHTGPTLTLPPHPHGYTDDRDVEEGAPSRSGDDLYFLTKLLGQEVCRVMAEQHAIACPVLLFCAFVDPTRPREQPLHPFAVSWADAGRAMAAAARVERLPEPSPVLNVLAPSPHGRYLGDRVQDVLGWHAVDRLDAFWLRGTAPTSTQGT
ncbi:NAD-dependent epimerase/dehydratase family protein [Occultella kanbiaonis]|uniref:NAD-dependent epimerase/dehydratase family protein n=1 Tax=Occultella kanbiaonis TaxID=2675754 RepID=UPI0013D68DC0|nr:NAD-dependent epimerase/dehydratase family protein [Occultella kanbiaonis]